MNEGTYLQDSVNVGPAERRASLLGGTALVLTALFRSSRATFPLALTGGYLIYRGLTGNCLVYEALNINRVVPERGGGIQVEKALEIARPREEVYQFWHNFENFPAFMSHLESVRVEKMGPDEPSRSHWVAKAPLETKVEWEAEVTEDRPNERIAWRSLPGSEIGNRGIVTFEDAPEGRGTVVRVSLQYNPPAGPASTAIARLFGEAPEIQVHDDLVHFKEIMEAGETPTILGQSSGRKAEVDKEREEIKQRKPKDVVQEASEESFPASDPPAWTGGPSL